MLSRLDSYTDVASDDSSNTILILNERIQWALESLLPSNTGDHSLEPDTQEDVPA